MSASTTGDGWSPVVSLDPQSASADAFADAVGRFVKETIARKAAGNLPAMPFTDDGWYDITPPMAEAALMHTVGNREYSWLTVKTYAADMKARDWQRTGETICVVNGNLRNGHHRLMSGYLSQETFPCFVVTSAPQVHNVFAYYDSGKKRTAADALHIAGWNGAGKALAGAVASLAMRYDAGVLGVTKQPRFKTPNSREVLDYVAQHPGLRDAAQLMMGTYPDAVEVIRSKPAAIFFAWLVTREHDETMLAEFCGPLGNGARLDEDSPILAARASLLAPEEKGAKVPDRTRLAYVNKAFNLWAAGHRMPRVRGKVMPLSFGLNEPFPAIVRPLAEAAE